MPDERLRGFPPILPDGPIRLLVLGSFPSRDSLDAPAYYAHSKNRFWPLMEELSVVPDARAPYVERVAAYRAKDLALWDLYASVERIGSGDDAICNAVLNNIPRLWKEYGPFPIALNGRRLREWRRNFADLPVQPLELPSTSPRPLHWNTPESVATAVKEWRSAFRAAGVHLSSGRDRGNAKVRSRR